MSKIPVGCYRVLFLFNILSVSVSSYEYGYHPSSEEFDGTMRDQTWTRDLLWQERNTKKFTPKFSLQKPKDTRITNSFIYSPNSSSDKKDTSTDIYMDSDTIGLSSEFVQEVTRDSKENQANQTVWPIYFTNPATGIVYAITKVGVNVNQTALPKNGSIPIFVSKEQYEQDLYLLKRSFESKCSRQRRPQIIQLDSGSFPSKPTSVTVKTELNVRGNRTRVKKRKNRHRKVKKTKTGQIVQISSKNSSFSTVTVSPLDTQLEKPNKVNLPSVFSSSQTIPHYSNSTSNKTKKSASIHTTKFHHKINRRSLNSTELNQISNDTSTTKRSLNSTDSGEQSKKILSSEHFEPTTRIRTPKNSLEETTNNPKSKFRSKPPSKRKLKSPCNDTKCKKSTSNDYDDYYDFGGPYYDDYSTGDDDTAEDDDGSNGSIEYQESSETTTTDYSSAEGASKPNEDYQPRKPLKKRIKRRRPYTNSDEYYEDYDDDYDYDNESDDGVMGLFRTIFTPVQWVMDKVFDRAGQMLNKNSLSGNDDDNDNRIPTYPQYTVYNSGSADEVTESEETSGDQGNSFGSWFSSWFGFKRKSRTTTPAPVEDEPGWFDSWFGYDNRTPSPNEEEDDDSWFFGWFNSKPRPKRTTTTTTTTPVPILTIAEPLKNPQKWIGILAQHIINSTSTNNPFIETTTENPEIPKKISYNKYQIWRLKPKDNSQVKALEDYKRGEEGARMQWLMGPSLRGLTDVLIPPKMLTDFQGTLNFEDIPHEILIFDVGKAISYEQAKQDDTSTIPQMKPGKGKAVMSWNRYYDYDSIITYLELVQQRNPQLVELIHVGRSYEGRPLVIVKVESKRYIEKPTKKKKLKLNKRSDLANGVFIEAGVHGREWIAPATATWMINELLKIMKNNRTNLSSEYIKNSTWYIMPVANPDSYEYSHQYDRLWKKSRSRHIAKPSGIINSAMTWLQKKKSEKLCFGVDLDCNWQYYWGKRGSSKSPCNEFFAGPSPFSEPETRAISKFLMDNRNQIRLFLSLQAYGQIISYPNKLNSSFQSQKLDDFLDVAMVGTDGLRKKGSKSRYKVDSSNDLIDSKSGSSDYFAAFEVGIPFSYTIHLADNGVHGFLLPSVNIEPTARDAFEIITAMIDYI